MELLCSQEAQAVRRARVNLALHGQKDEVNGKGYIRIGVSATYEVVFYRVDFGWIY
jgi:hypothetical protein